MCVRTRALALYVVGRQCASCGVRCVRCALHIVRCASVSSSHPIARPRFFVNHVAVTLPAIG